MSNFTGIATASLQMGLQSVLIKPVRGMYAIRGADGAILPNIIAQATIEEQHIDNMEITEHPIQQGAAIADHAFKRPAELVLHLGWSNSPSHDSSLINSAVGAAAALNASARQAAGLYNFATGVQSAISGAGSTQINAIYQQLQDLQNTRALFAIYTSKRVYTNMMCKSLATRTDNKTANSMPVTMHCHQVFLVNTQTVTLPKYAQKVPSVTASPVQSGAKSLVPK